MVYGMEGSLLDKGIKNPGRLEIEQIYENNELSIYDKDAYSRLLFIRVQDLLAQGCSYERIIYFLDEFPIIKYYDNFIALLERRICRGIIDREEVVALGRKLLLQDRSINLKKLGLTLLHGDNNSEVSEEILYLGTSSELAFYVSRLLICKKDSEEILLKLAKGSKDVGRVFYLGAMDVLTRENVIYMLKEGWKGKSYQGILWNITIGRVGYEYYLYDSNLNEDIFISFGEVLNNIFVYYDYEKLKVFNKLVKKYIDVFTSYSKDINSYIALGNIYKYIVEDGQIEDEYYKKIQKLYYKVNWMDIFNKALKDGNTESTLLLQLAIEMEEDLTLDELEELLNRNPRDLPWYKYIEMLGERDKSNLLIKVIEENFNVEEVLSNEGSSEVVANEDEVDDLALINIAIESLIDESISDNVEFLLGCLESKNKDLKNKVIEKLWSVKDNWSKETKNYLKEVINKEKNSSIKNKLIFMIDEQEKRFITTEVTGEYVDIDDMDIPLCSGVISSSTYKKFKNKEELVKEGDGLILSCGLDGYKEDKLFVITNFGVVLGELLQRESRLLCNLLNAGENVVCKVDKINQDLDFIYLSIYKKSDYLMNELKDIINEQLQNIFPE